MQPQLCFDNSQGSLKACFDPDCYAEAPASCMKSMQPQLYPDDSQVASEAYSNLDCDAEAQRVYASHTLFRRPLVVILHMIHAASKSLIRPRLRRCG